MKLSTNDVQNLNNILNTCAVCNIDVILIEDSAVYGINEAKTAVLISKSGIPEFPQKVALSRLTSLRNRLSLFGDMLAIDAKESEKGELVFLDLASGKSKAQFRCTPTILVKPPRVIHDTESVKITFSKEELRTLLQASKVMGSKKVGIAVKANGIVSFSAMDESHDVFSSEIDCTAEFLDSPSTVYYDYSTDILTSVLKKAFDEFEEYAVFIGENGTLTCRVNGHNITLLPLISDDSDDND